MHIVLYYTHDTTIFSSDPVIYYLILAILVRAQSNFVPDFTGTGYFILQYCDISKTSDASERTIFFIIHTQTDRCKGNQHTWQISSCQNYNIDDK